MNALQLKMATLEYWRFKEQCPMVALEASCTLRAFKDGGAADVLAVTKTRLLIETEVKLTLSDLRRDSEKPKHIYFKQGLQLSLGSSALPSPSIYPTSLFYFAIPFELRGEAIQICEHLYPYAGVLLVDRYGEAMGDCCVHSQWRRPQRLSTTKLTGLQLMRMAREQSATLCRLARQAVLLAEGDERE